MSSRTRRSYEGPRSPSAVLRWLINDTASNNRNQLVLLGMQNRTAGPYQDAGASAVVVLAQGCGSMAWTCWQSRTRARMPRCGALGGSGVTAREHAAFLCIMQVERVALQVRGTLSCWDVGGDRVFVVQNRMFGPYLAANNRVPFHLWAPVMQPYTGIHDPVMCAQARALKKGTIVLEMATYLYHLCHL
jgi:hypothetical protein